jgi:uncharacterized protein
VPIPESVLRVRFGDIAHVMVGGQEASPARLREAGYAFRHARLEGALEDLLRPRAKPVTQAAAEDS